MSNHKSHVSIQFTHLIGLINIISLLITETQFTDSKCPLSFSVFNAEIILFWSPTLFILWIINLISFFINVYNQIIFLFSVEEHSKFISLNQKLTCAKF